MKELGRQLVHMGFAAATIAFGLAFGRVPTLVVVIALLSIGLLLINLKMLGLRIPVIDYFLTHFERPRVFLGKGALYHVAGVLFALAFSLDFYFALAAIAFVGFGDGFSTIVGANWGKHSMPWNKKKTWEGTFAFLLTAGAAGYPLIGASSFIYAPVLALVETIPTDIDDNLVIPAVAIILRAFAGPL